MRWSLAGGAGIVLGCLPMLLAGQDPIQPAASVTPVEHAVLTGALMENNPPLTFAKPGGTDEQGGLIIEALDAIFKEAGIPFAVKVFPWKRAQAMVESGQLDFLVTVPTEPRLQYALSSTSPVIPMEQKIFTYKGHPKQDQMMRIRGVEDLKAMGLVVASNLGNGWIKQNIEEAGVTVFYAPQDESMAKMLAARRADIVIDPEFSFVYDIRKADLVGQVICVASPFPPTPFHFLLGKNSPFAHLMPRIDAAITKLAHNGTLARLRAKYAAVP